MGASVSARRARRVVRRVVGKRTQGTGDPGQKAIPVGSGTSPHFQPDWYESAVLLSTVTFRLWPVQWIPRREWRGVRAP